jgi:L-ascorbate metabolism protein UlaG (beta-lactamase superfamily)
MIKVRSTAAFAFLISTLLLFHTIAADSAAMQDTFTIHTLGHSSIYFEYAGLIIHADPNSDYANYDSLPDADLIFITHGHSDHFDVSAMNKIRKDSTLLVCPEVVKGAGGSPSAVLVMDNGDSIMVKGIPVKAVPAYNLSSTLHPKGQGNGYVLTFGEKRIYIPGDTDLIPELDSLGKIDIAFIPMNIAYSMTDSVIAEAVKMIQPAILYLYHFGTVDTAVIRTLLPGRELIIRTGTSVYSESCGQPASADIQWGRAVYGYNALLDGRNRCLSFRCAHPEAIVSLFDLMGRRHRLAGIGARTGDARSMSPGVYIVNYQRSERASRRLISAGIP